MVGQGIADVLFGKMNPSGRLAASVGRSEGKLPAYYNRYPFGYGLSYTSFAFGDLSIQTGVREEEAEKGGSVKVGLVVSNTGSRAGLKFGSRMASETSARRF